MAQASANGSPISWQGPLWLMSGGGVHGVIGTSRWVTAPLG